ncbi:MAG: hypothetical protein JSS75_04145 [Bacteroidetes bacterium]|nr:hypothetical protein [Bacteroidota bacterium]
MKHRSDLVLEELRKGQSEYGGILSEVSYGGQVVTDLNCAVSSLVAIECACDQLVFSESLKRTLSRILDFVEECMDEANSGWFRFYPSKNLTPKISHQIFDCRIPDLDDTCLAYLALIKHNRLSVSEVAVFFQKVVPQLEVSRLSNDDGYWVRLGALRTWLVSSANLPHNPVDVCVNVNAAAAMALCGLRGSALFRTVCESVESATYCFLHQGVKFAEIAPYYSHPIELVYAIQRAVLYGAERLQWVLDELLESDWSTIDEGKRFSASRSLSCSSDRKIHWHAPTLQIIRKMLKHDHME